MDEGQKLSSLHDFIERTGKLLVSQALVCSEACNTSQCVVGWNPELSTQQACDWTLL